jgi:hypothetical protein
VSHDSTSLRGGAGQIAGNSLLGPRQEFPSHKSGFFLLFRRVVVTAQVSKTNGSTWGSETYSIADVIDANGDFRFCPSRPPSSSHAPCSKSRNVCSRNPVLAWRGRSAGRGPLGSNLEAGRLMHVGSNPGLATTYTELGSSGVRVLITEV